MRGEKIFRSISMLPDEMVLEADRPIVNRKRIPKHWAALAACAALAFFWIFRLTGIPGADSANLQEMDGADQQSAEVTGSQQMLKPVTLGWIDDGSDFKEVIAASAGELENGCPWDTSDPPVETLPVYEGKNEMTAGGTVRFGLDADEMEQLLRELAQALGYRLETVTTRTDGTQVQGDQQPCAVDGMAAGATFEVVATGAFTMTLKEPAPLPEEYRLTPGSSRADAERTAVYLAQQYAGALGMEDPRPQVQLEYSAAGERRFSLRVRGGGDLSRQLLEYSFGGLQFFLNDAAELTGLRLWGTQAAGESLGDHPLITAAQAAKSLAEGRCYTSVTESFPGIEYLAATELVYREGNEVVAPYYRLLVELPTLARGDGLKTYGVYYVPAISPEYLNDPPAARWDAAE